LMRVAATRHALRMPCRRWRRRRRMPVNYPSKGKGKVLLLLHAHVLQIPNPHHNAASRVGFPVPWRVAFCASAAKALLAGVAVNVCYYVTPVFTAPARAYAKECSRRVVRVKSRKRVRFDFRLSSTVQSARRKKSGARVRKKRAYATRYARKSAQQNAPRSGAQRCCRRFVADAIAFSSRSFHDVSPFDSPNDRLPDSSSPSAPTLAQVREAALLPENAR